MLRRLALLPLLVVAAHSLTCQDLDLLCSGAHPIEFSYTLNQSAIPSFDGSAYIWAKTGTVVTSQTESIHCQEYTNYLLITSNGIPNHDVGKFPFTVSTVGRRHGDNPNTIQAQQYQWKIPKTPVPKTSPPTKNIMSDFNALQMGPIGFALNGVPIFNPFNAQHEDAVKAGSDGFEVMDLCWGHPQMHGGYHYHHQAPKAGCLFTDTAGAHSPKIGYAFDGIPVYGPLSDNGVKPSDLDLCNGRTHPTKGYIYHITELKAPYMIGCYMYQTTDMVQGGTISTSAASAVKAQSTACASKIGQHSAQSTGTTPKMSSTTKPSTGGTTTIGGGCPAGMPTRPSCPTGCTSDAQCSGATSVCCKPTGCAASGGTCLRPCPTVSCPATGCTRGTDSHGCPTCSCSGQGTAMSPPPPSPMGSRPPPSSRPPRTTAVHATGSGPTGTHHRRTTAPHTGTGTHPRRTTAPHTGTGTHHRRTTAPHTGTGTHPWRTTAPRTGTGTHHRRTTAPHTGTGTHHRRTTAPHTGTGTHHRRTTVPHTGTGTHHRRTTAPHTGTGTHHRRTTVPHTGTGTHHRRTTVPHTGTGTHHRRTTAPHTGTGIRPWRSMPHHTTAGVKSTTKNDANGVSGANGGNAVTTEGSSSGHKPKTVMIVAIVVGIVLALGIAVAIIVVIKRRKQQKGTDPTLAATYRQLQAGD